jgi:hypothetical protein
MMGTSRVARVALMGAAVVLGSSVLAPSAWADTESFNLNVSNLGAGFTGPFIQVTVNRTSTTTATFTFDSLTNGGFTYLMHSQGAAFVNINATTFTLNSFSASNSLLGFNAPVPSNGGSRTEDGFGSFNQGISLFDGFNSSGGGAATEIIFSVTNTSGTWASVANVLAANGSGNLAAAQIGACPVVCNGTTGSFANTGFASTPGPVVGAGIPGILMACGGLIALARRRRQKIV